jgi:hypothetical protein
MIRSKKLLHCAWLATLLLLMKSDLGAWYFTSQAYYVGDNECDFAVYGFDFTNTAQDGNPVSCSVMASTACPSRCGDESLYYAGTDCFDDGGDPPNFGTCYCSVGTCEEGCDCEDPECDNPECIQECSDVGDDCEAGNDCCDYGSATDCESGQCCLLENYSCSSDEDCCGNIWGGMKCLGGYGERYCGECVATNSLVECSSNNDCCSPWATCEYFGFHSYCVEFERLP